MPTPAVQSLFSSLQRSHLLTAEQLAEAERFAAGQEKECSPQKLLQHLVQQDLLTRWQAQRLLAGKHSFILGRYKLVDQLGQGGMGAVFKAEHTALKRTVAIKVMAPALVKTPGTIERFQREIQAVAALDHPNIVAAYDADCVQNTHFLVMEYVEGKDLTVYARPEQPLPIGWSCECIRQAALGLQHAHERGMAHRDIKPANLLVTKSADDRGLLVKILDMGLARFVSESGADGSLTQTGVVMGTPDYIAPEQAANTKQADIRSDIFSLGCTLFRMLTGKLPYPGVNVVEKLMARALQDAPPIRSVRPDIPPELEAVIARMLARNPAERFQTPAEVATALAPHTESVSAAPARTTSKPQNRPAASETATTDAEVDDREVIVRTVNNPEFDQFLKDVSSDIDLGDSDAVTPHSPGSGLLAAATGDGSQADTGTHAVPSQRRPDRLRGSLEKRKQADKRLFVLAGAALGIAGLLAVAWAVWIQAGKTLVIVQWAPAEREGGTLELDGRQFEVPLKGNLAFPGTAGDRRLHLTRDGYEPLEFNVPLARGEKRTIAVEWKPTPQTARKLELAALKREVQQAITSFGLRPPSALDAKVVALKKKLNQFQTLESRLQPVPPRPEGGTPTPRQGVPSTGAARPTADERLQAIKLAAKLPSPLDQLKAIDIPDADRFGGQPQQLVAILGEHRGWTDNAIDSLLFSEDGKTLVSNTGHGSGGQSVRLYDPLTMDLRAQLQAVTRACAFTRNGQELLVTGVNDLRFCDAKTLDLRDRFEIPELPGQILRAAFSPDNKTIALLTSGILLRVLDLYEGKAELRATIEAHIENGGAMPILFTPDGRTIITGGGGDATVKLWNLPTSGPPTLRATLSGHKGFINGIAVTPDGKTLATSAQNDGLLRLWDLTQQDPPVRDTLSLGQCYGVNYSHDGRLLAAGLQREILLFDTATSPPRQVAKMQANDGGVTAVAFSPDDTQIVAGDAGGWMRLWDLSRLRPKERVFRKAGHSRPASGVVVSPDETWLASVGYDGLLIFWNAATGRELRRVSLGRQLLLLDISPDGGTLAVADIEGTIRIQDAATDAVQHTFKSPFVPDRMQISPDGRWLGCSARHAGILFWDLKTGAPEALAASSPGAANCFAFSPDGNLLAFIETGQNGNIAIGFRDIAAREYLPPLKIAEARDATALGFAPDGKSLALATMGGPVHVWDLVRRVARKKIPGDGSGRTGVCYAPDGSLGALRSNNGWFLLFNPATGERPAWVEQPQFLGLAVAFAPDCRHMAAANQNGTVSILRVKELDWEP